MACAILERISGFEQLLQGIEACYSTQLLSVHIDLSLKAISAVCHQSCILSTDSHLMPCAGFVETSTSVSSSCSFSAIGKSQIDNNSAAYANLSVMFFQSISHNQV